MQTFIVSGRAWVEFIDRHGFVKYFSDPIDIFEQEHEEMVSFDNIIDHLDGLWKNLPNEAEAGPVELNLTISEAKTGDKVADVDLKWMDKQACWEIVDMNYGKNYDLILKPYDKE